ncbi:MAG: AtpZ/AtpI family protein [Clostridia bacterium]|nr:AtpZ/AtpI family protein [Clostridiales bacterium]MBQ3232282.1 AtpZ/AtpI family protein [Clostridia bacterium]MBQ6716431.1 AtpZ/AtpI family protein [Clostridia bacterium]
MKELNMLVWLTQLGMGVAVPLAGFIWLGIWLKNKFSLGPWCVILFCIIGMITAFDGLRASLKIMERLDRSKRKEEKQGKAGVSFNDHD